MHRMISAVLAAPAAAGLLALALPSPGAASTVEPVVISSSASQKTALNWGTGKGKSYLIPAFEIPSFLLALNMFDRTVYGKESYGTNLDTLTDNVVHEKWVYDTDSFSMNQFGHPYLGSFMYGFARSSGLNFWESLAYSDMGSFLWESGGELTRQSTNDLLTTGQAGCLIGESLFRMSNLTLENGGDEPGFWRKLGAAVISPPTAINRFLFGERLKTVYSSHGPATFSYLQVLGNLQQGKSSSGVTSAPDKKHVGADFTMSYGLPGKDGYKYIRPFDYFNFKVSVISNSGILEDVMIRGLGIGKKYEVGDNYRGVWGLYGTYDFISPTIFRVSNTAAALGTTGQWWLSRNTALQGTVLAGPGYGGGGTISMVGQRNYHMGASGEGLLALRLIVDKKLMLNANLRAYDISGINSPESGVSEMIARGDVSITVLIHGPHALGLQYVESRRYSRFPTIGGSYQKVSMTSLAYSLVFDPHFGAVEWRDGMDSGNR